MEQEIDRDSASSDPEIPGVPPAGELVGEAVECGDGDIRSVRAELVTLRRCLVSEVSADHVSVRQGAVRNMTADGVDLLQGAVFSARTGSLLLRASAAGAVGSGGETSVDSSVAGLVMSKGDISMDSSPALAVVAQNVRAENSKAAFLIARRVEGDIKPLFGTREALAFGLAVGTALCVARLLTGLLKRG